MGSDGTQLVLQEHRDRLMALAGVVGVGIGEFEGQPCIVVYVLRNKRVDLKIPSHLEAYPIRIEETDEFHALG